MDKSLERLVMNCEKTLKENLICILLLGSAQKAKMTPFSDIDLVMVVKTFQAEQMSEIRQLVKESKEFLDLPFLCWDEIPQNPNEFRIGTHGCYELELVLKKATCLYGKNIFLELGTPFQEKIRASILDKISQYTCWARRMFLESNRERSIGSNYRLNTRLIKTIRDFLYLSGFPNIHAPAEDAVYLFLEKCPGLLSEKESIELLSLTNKTLTSRKARDMSEEYLKVRFSIINKVYKAAMKIFFNKNCS